MKKFDLDISFAEIVGGSAEPVVSDLRDPSSYEVQAEKFARKLELNRMKKHRVFCPEDFVLYAVIFKHKDC